MCVWLCAKSVCVKDKSKSHDHTESHFGKGINFGNGINQNPTVIQNNDFYWDKSEFPLPL